MEPIEKKQIAKLMEDITAIKQVISENKPLLRQLLLPIHFRIISLIGGVAIIFISALYYFLLEKYGTYHQIPQMARYFAIGLIAISWVSVLILKRLLWMKSLKKFDNQMTFGQLVKHLYSYQILHLWIPVLVIMVVLMIYFGNSDVPQFMVVVVAVGLGVIYNSLGSITRIWQYLVVGYWTMITGILPLLISDIPALFALALSLGCGLLIFAFTSGTPRKKEA